MILNNNGSRQGSIRKIYLNLASQLSTNRSGLMGFAAIWIMLFHMQTSGNIAGQYSLIAHFFGVGFSGVDIFILLSGFGLYGSYQRTKSLKRFYIKRFVRILPTFWVIILLFYVIRFLLTGTFEFLCLLQDLSTLGIWLKPLGWVDTFWYIGAIVAFYILTPILCKFIDNITLNKVIVWTIIWVIMCFVINRILHHFYINYFIGRLPIFLIGLWCGKIPKHQIAKSLNTFNKSNFILVIVGAFFYIILSFLLFDKKLLAPLQLSAGLYIIIIPMIVGGVHIISYILYRNHYINCWLIKLGAMSLELYLVHGCLIKVLVFLNSQYNLLLQITCFVATIIICYPLNILLQHVNNKILNSFHI